MTNSDYPTKTYDLTEDFELNETYTATLYGEVTDEMYFSAFTGTTGTDQAGVFSKIRDGVYVATLRLTSFSTDPDAAKKLQIYAMPGNKKLPATIKRIKLERGNVATDWTPAPEDILDRLAALEEKLKS